MAKKKAATAAAALMLSASAMALLATVVGFGDSGTFLVPSADSAELLAFVPPLIEKGPDGNGTAEGGPIGTIGVRATDAGKAYKPAVPVAAPTADAPKPSFTLFSNVPVPETVRKGGRGASIYPFAEMAVGQSFFIAASAKHPEPAKSLGSTASSATRRYLEAVVDATGNPVMESYKVRAVGTPGQADYVAAHDATRQKMKETRKFIIKAIADGAPYNQSGVAGAAIFRTL